MTKEEILRTFLEDKLFTDKGYLKVGQAEKYRWSTEGSKLIEVLKLAIEGESVKESVNIIERKINTFLNRES